MTNSFQNRFSGESSVLAPQLNNGPNIQIIPFQIHQIIPSANRSNSTNSSVSSCLSYSSDSQKSHNFPLLELFYRTLTKNQASEALHLRWKSTRGLVKKWASQYLQMLVELTNIRWQDPNNSSDIETRCLVQRGLVKKWASTEYLNAGSACLAFSLLQRKKELLLRLI